MTGSEFVNRIDELLKNRNLKRQALIDYCGINSSALSDWIRRDTLPSLEVGIKISEFLGVSINWLMNEKYPDSWLSYDDDATTDGIWLSPRGIMRRIEIVIREQTPRKTGFDPFSITETFFDSILEIMTFSQIQSAFQNSYEPTLIQLFEISKILKVSLGWLISGSDRREIIPTDRWVLGLAQDYSEFLKYYNCLPDSDQEQITNLVIHLFHSRSKIRETLIDKGIDVSDIPDLIK